MKMKGMLPDTTQPHIRRTPDACGEEDCLVTLPLPLTLTGSTKAKGKEPSLPS